MRTDITSFSVGNDANSAIESGVSQALSQLHINELTPNQYEAVQFMRSCITDVAQQNQPHPLNPEQNGAKEDQLGEAIGDTYLSESPIQDNSQGY